MGTQYDTVIRNGLIVDGSGGEPVTGDVAIHQGRIAATGQVAGQGATEIDAGGQLVTPGFVDIHTHYDGQITWEQRLAPSSYHGVTTVVMGNCGVGFAPCRADDRERLVRVMEGVEDIPEVVMTDGLPWTWESFPDYLDLLSRREADMDFAAQLPHAPLRVYVMGERGADAEALPTEAELEQMSELVAEALRAGATGVSTSRSLAHRTRAGVLAPTVESEDAELLALAEGMRRAGSGVFQMIPAGAGYGADEDELPLMRALVEASGGRPLSYTLLNNALAPESHSRFMKGTAEAVADGLPIRGQVFPRPVGILFGLDLSFHPFRYNPSFAPLADLPLADKVAAMREPSLRQRLLAEQAEHSNPIFSYLASQAETLFELGDPPNYEPSPEDSIGARASREGRDPREMAYDLLLEDGGRNLLFLPAANYLGNSLDSAAQMMQDPNTLIGLGDGGAHYGMICDGSFPTTLLAFWTRDRDRGTVPLPWAVHALSRRNALAMGFADRGLLAPGMKADINVIDYERLQLRRPEVIHDLPAGGRRLIQRASGYTLTMVNGVVTYRDGEATGELPGRLLRGAGSGSGSSSESGAAA